MLPDMTCGNSPIFYRVFVDLLFVALLFDALLFDSRIIVRPRWFDDCKAYFGRNAFSSVFGFACYVHTLKTTSLPAVL